MRTLAYAMVFTLFSTVEALSQATDNCSALLQHGLSDITKKYGESYALVTNYQRHCGSITDSTSDRIVAQAGIEIFGIAGGDTDADIVKMRSMIQNWCNVNRDFAESNMSYFEEVRHINTSAVEAYRDCQQFNRRDIEISVQRSDDLARTVSITLDSHSDGEYKLTAIVTKAYSCEYFKARGAGQIVKFLVNETTDLNVPIQNDNLHISCMRDDPSEQDEAGAVKRITFDHASIQVFTSGPALHLEFPEIVETYYATPPGTILAVIGDRCPAGWKPFERAAGRLLIGASQNFPLGREGGRQDIPSGGSHTHAASATHDSGHYNEGSGFTRYEGQRVRHGHDITVQADGTHNHGGDNMPPYLSVTYCRN